MVGQFSGYLLTPVNECTIVGNQAGYQCGNGNQNTIIGHAAHRGGNAAPTNSGSQNTYVGAYASFNGGGANGSNTAVGYQALYGSTTGGNRSQNVAVGVNSMQNIDSGQWNTCVGTSTGGSISTGSNNTMVGWRAGFGLSGPATTTGTNVMCLGYDAVATTATISNQITLGNNQITTLRCQVTSITALSDRRDKKDIENVPVGLDFINALRPVKFVWDTRPVLDEEGNEFLDDNGDIVINGKHDIKEIGFIAQELLEVEESFGVKEWTQIVLDDNPDKLEAAPAKLLPIMVKAIQELSAKIESLEAQLAK
jgi:hypothetical protein